MPQPNTSGRVAAVATSCGPLGAPGILLEEAGCHAGQVLRLRQGAPRLRVCFQALPAYCILEGHQFTIYTDQNPLTYALSRTSDPWSARQARQLSYLAEHTADIRHITGEENIVADTLSRPPPSAAANVKEPSGSLAAAWQGGSSESSSPTMVQPTVCAVPATVYAAGQ
jgi:hypothetical protein